MLSDVYDGNLWQKLIASGYLNSPTSLACMLNVDWYQDFTKTIYSSGSVYLVILNLPREIRMKEENMILLAEIPGPNEPTTMEYYLKPLVKELKVLDKGVVLDDGRILRMRLQCISCDSPATRKVSYILLRFMLPLTHTH